MIDELAKPAGVYMMTLWWHSRGDEAANAELADILTAQGLLSTPTDLNAPQDRDAALRAATEDETTRELLANWCDRTRARRGEAGVQHASKWLPQATAAMATETDPDAVNRQHHLVVDMLTKLPPGDVADPAIAQAIAEHLNTYNAHAIHPQNPGR